MSLRVNTNVSAINTHRNLITNNTEQSKSMERLSSGMKINRGADGPASLVISERLRSQTAGLKQAIDNSERASSVIATAEGYLAEVADLLNSVKSLVVEAANTGGVSEEEIEAKAVESRLQRLEDAVSAQVDAAEVSPSPLALATRPRRSPSRPTLAARPHPAGLPPARRGRAAGALTAVR